MPRSVDNDPWGSGRRCVGPTGGPTGGPPGGPTGGLVGRRGRANGRANGWVGGKPRVLRDIVKAFRRPHRFARCRFACATGTAKSGLRDPVSRTNRQNRKTHPDKSPKPTGPPHRKTASVCTQPGPKGDLPAMGFAGIRHIENQGFARAVLTGPIFAGYHPARRLRQSKESHNKLVLLCANLVNRALGAICHYRAANDLKKPSGPRDAP